MGLVSKRMEVNHDRCGDACNHLRVTLRYLYIKRYTKPNQDMRILVSKTHTERAASAQLARDLGAVTQIVGSSPKRKDVLIKCTTSRV